MNATNTARLRRLLHLRPTVPDRYRELIARHVRGRTFIDVGCMWGVHGAYAFHALDGGATQVTGVDLMSQSPEFVTRNLAYEGASASSRATSTTRRPPPRSAPPTSSSAPACCITSPIRS